jgi:RNA polymerase sigma-70 factor (ECF subfamily)
VEAEDGGPRRCADEDEEIVRRVLAGDRDLFEQLVLRHQRRVIYYLTRMVKNPDLAEDLAQITFVKAFTALASFDPRYRFSTWIYRIASNAAIDHLRRNRLRPLSIDQPLETAEGTVEQQLPSPGPGPDELAARGEVKLMLRRAVDRLPAEYRQLIALRHGSECSYEEICEITGLPMGTVKNRLFRARNQLRQLLAGTELEPGTVQGGEEEY